MANLKITVPKIHCKKKQDWITPDKVYLAFLVVNGKDVTNNNVEEQVDGKINALISPVNSPIRKGKIQKFDLGNGIGESVSVDIEDSEAFSVIFGLYEKDSGDAYDQINESFENSFPDNFTNLPEPNSPGFSNIVQIVLEELPTGISADKILDFLFGVGKKVFGKFRKDDIIGNGNFSHKIDDPNLNFTREFHDLKMNGSEYNLQIKVEVE